MKSQQETWRFRVFGLGIAGAFLSTLSTQIPAAGWSKSIALPGALCLGFVPVFTQRKLKPELTRAWVRARSASEGLKSEAYRFFVRAAPYEIAQEAEGRLRERVKEIEEAVEDLQQYQARVEVKASIPPNAMDPASYIQKRLLDQVTWYRNNSTINARKVDGLRRNELILALAAAALAAAGGVLGEAISIAQVPIQLGVWVAVLTTIGGTITTHISATRLDYLVTSYAATANRLEDLATEWNPQQGIFPSPDWSAFVTRCESSISNENQGWMTKWTKKADKK